MLLVLLAQIAFGNQDRSLKSSGGSSSGGRGSSGGSRGYSSYSSGGGSYSSSSYTSTTYISYAGYGYGIEYRPVILLGYSTYAYYYAYAYYGSGFQSECYPQDLECIADVEKRRRDTFIFIGVFGGFFAIIIVILLCLVCRKGSFFHTCFCTVLCFPC